MNHINFLDKKAPLKKSIEINLLALSLAMGLMLISGIAFGVVQHMRLRAWQSEQAIVEAEIAELKALVAQQDQAKASGPDFSALNEPIVWSKLIEEFSSKVPFDVQILRINGALGEGRKLSIEGQTRRVSAATEFKYQLAALSWCEKIEVGHLSQGEQFEEKRLLNFKLECKLR